MAKIYGYCRISTRKQDIERQIRNIKKEYEGKRIDIYREEYTGTTTDRPNWKRLNSLLKEGDTVVFDSVSRMSRNAEECMELYEELFNRGVNIVFLKESYVNTDVYRQSLEQAQTIKTTGSEIDPILEGVKKYLLIVAKKQIKLAFEQSEKEVMDLRQRTKEGIETARNKGKQIGGVPGKKLTTKKSIQCKNSIIQLCDEFKGDTGMSDKQIMDVLSLSRNTYYKYKREIREELEKECK